LTRIDSLTAGVAGRLGVQRGGSSSTTNNLEAYRLYTLGLDKAATFRNREAIDLFQRAVQLDPDFAMAHARTGYACAVTWNLANEARPHLERAYKLSHRLTPKDRKFIEGWYAIANLDFPRAVQVFRDIVRAYPGESEAFIRLGLLLRGEDRLDEALKVAQEGLAAHPGEAEFHDLEAGILAQLGRHDEAIAAARRYVDRVPGESEAHDLLGEIYQWAGRAPEAEASYRKARELAPGFERPVVHLGNLYFQLGRYRDAIRQYEHYIEIAPSELERGRGWGRIAWVWWRLGNREKAAEAAAKELSMVPSAVWNSIVLALARGDAAEVARLRPRMDLVSFTSRGARTGQRYREYFEGYIALKQGRAEEALTRLRKAVYQHAAPYWSMEAYEDCLADGLLELGQNAEAVTEYRRVVARNPGNATARFHLAQALDRLGRKEESRQEYRKFAEMWRSADPEIPELRNLPH
jgi:tetratricopeptide (TPR) repeat protein